ncbi:MAG: Gfo/Idh/MocA family oxidoreductase [Ignavibacteriales bacterium]|nr:Gfo/Idh/MocA family oxidoreductase [Ignavibacteriales bacterium]
MTTRRDFIKKSALAAAGVTIGGIGLSAKSYGRIKGANDRINFAIIGLHGRAYAHLEGAKMCNNTMVTHVCDVDKRELDKFAIETEKKFNQAPMKEKDFRKILESKDVDAITIATPEHWHAIMAIMALQAGKHVYVEKPSSHNPYEGELLVQAQKKYGKLVQMGNQQRSSPHTIEIMKKIQDGIIGRPYFGKAWYSNTRTSIGVGKVVPVPDYLDWDLWQGPAPRREYKDNIHPYNWHWFWNWGTGETLNNGTHEVDLCRWALGVDYPNRVSASGGRYHFKDDWEFYDTLVTSYEYDDKMITWEGMSCQGKQYYGRGRGATIHGTKGTVLVDRDGYQVFTLDDKKIDEFDLSNKTTTQDLVGMDTMTIQHFQNFINGITMNEKLHSPIDEGNISVTILQLSNIAWKFNRILNLDKNTGHILNDNEAAKYWRRKYEKGWEPKV